MKKKKEEKSTPIAKQSNGKKKNMKKQPTLKPKAFARLTIFHFLVKYTYYFIK